MKVRTRIWLETAIALATAILAAATVIVPAWIETVLRLDPDGGNGLVEWGITGAFALLTIVFAVAARLEYRSATRAVAPANDH